LEGGFKDPWGKYSEVWSRYIDSIAVKRAELAADRRDCWTEAHSWAVNLAYYLYRCGQRQEASYLIEGVRCGSVKYLTGKDPLYDALNHSLLELRMGFRWEKTMIARGTGIATAYCRSVEELRYFMATTEPRNIGYENEAQFPHTAYWFQPLALVFGIALSGAPNRWPTRSEVDPFGGGITYGNAFWVSRNYVEALTASDWISKAEIEPPSWVMEPKPRKYFTRGSC